MVRAAFQLKTKYDAWLKKVLAMPRVLKLYQIEVTVALLRSWLLSITRHHSDLKFLISRWSYESHIFVTVRGECTPILEDVACLTMLSVFGDSNSTAVVLKGEDEVKQRYLNSLMSASKHLGSQCMLLGLDV